MEMGHPQYKQANRKGEDTSQQLGQTNKQFLVTTFISKQNRLYLL
jgi:hypothetical protein